MSTPAQDVIGRRQLRRGMVTATSADILAATLDRDDPPLVAGDPVPAGWHWLFFHEVVPLSRVGADGHAARGDFIPDVGLPRRMWAGSRMRFIEPLRVGDSVEDHASITAATLKQGASGALHFVTVTHEVRAGNRLLTVEEQDLVFRAPAPHSPRRRAAPPDARWSRRLQPDPVMLFRFSALTMNSHRIHYDREYATRAEGYPGLVVHGPLLMILLLDFARRRRPADYPLRFEARALAPLFDTEEITVAGKPLDGDRGIEAWAVGPEGCMAMHGRVEYRGPAGN